MVPSVTPHPTLMPLQLMLPTLTPTLYLNTEKVRERNKIIYLITVVEAAVAIACSLFVIVSYLRFPSLQKRSLELVTMLSFSVLCANLAYISYETQAATDHSSMCIAQGFFIQYFYCAIVLWAFTIGCALFSIVVLRDAFITRRQSHAVVWTLALGLSLPPLFVDGWFFGTEDSAETDYGNAGPFCWIKNDDTFARSLRLGLFYGPCWVALVVMTLMIRQV